MSRIEITLHTDYSLLDNVTLKNVGWFLGFDSLLKLLNHDCVDRPVQCKDSSETTSSVACVLLESHTFDRIPNDLFLKRNYF